MLFKKTKRSNRMESEREFLVRSTQKEILGPFTLEELEIALRSKKINPLDEVASSCGNWTPIKHFEQLLKVLGEVPSHTLGDMTKSMTQELDLKKDVLPKSTVLRTQSIRKLASEKRRKSISSPRIITIISLFILVVAGFFLLRGKEKKELIPSVDTPVEVQNLPLGFKEAYHKGVILEDAALFQGATEAYERALRIVPNNVAARIRIAAIKIQEGKFIESEADLSKLNTEEELSIEQKKEIANYRSVVALALNNDEEAEKFSRQAIVFSENFAPAYFNLGKSLFRQRKYFDAKDAFEKSVKFQPNQTLPFLYLGNTLGMTKKWEEAIDEFRNATQVNPRESLPFLYLAYGYKSIQRWNDTNKVLESMISLDPDYEENHKTDERYSRDENEYKNLISDFSSYILTSNFSSVARAELSLIQFLYGDKEQGVNSLEQIVRENQSLSSIHAILGYVYLRQGKTDNAKLQLQEALRFDYSNELAHTLLGDLLLATGEASEAITHYNKVLSANAFNLSALQGLAVYYFGRQEFAEAKRIEEQILQTDANYIPARRGLLKIEEAQL